MMERTFATDVSIAFGVGYNGAWQTKVWAKSLGKSFTPPGFASRAFAVRADPRAWRLMAVREGGWRAVLPWSGAGALDRGPVLSVIGSRFSSHPLPATKPVKPPKSTTAGRSEFFS
jgi:hypothetical protein